MNNCVSIVDYDMGNIQSIKNAVRSHDCDAELVSTPEQILESKLLILPGVGAYRDAMNKLRSNGLDSALSEYVASGRPLLGICLGMQLLFQRSEENGGVDGLGLLEGCVKRFPSVDGYSIPQIQWNQVAMLPQAKMFNGISENDYFYFLHSYFVTPSQDYTQIARTSYCDMLFCSAIEADNVWGAQFHPEKSAGPGLKMLGNFLTQGEKYVER
jgi:glutamine amidotransferase